ncbi:terpene synthase family protein [Streptomyces sp. NBC_01136]|uniref:terpene synthase family protein n=1 Tax=unclassified Streptomyces TaxID=2593676 RepID=UPI003249A379|nr:terpene synthase family protein [Streptomyces sp. NBC_01136]WST81208.1 terpene synthase family protein [Streptomyces sp. NBC_01136]
MGQLLRWAQQVGLASSTSEQQRLAAMGLDVLAMRMVPTADERDVALTAQWSAFICLVDDYFDRDLRGTLASRAESVLQRLLSVLAGEEPQPDSTGPEVALADLWRRTAPRMSPRWRDRFIADYTDFGRATCEEAVHRERRHQLPLDTYMALRRRTITVLPMTDIVECTAAASLPDSPELFEQCAEGTRLRALRCAGADVVGWTNDLASAEADRRRGQNNLLTVMEHERGCSSAESRTAVVSMRDARLRDFRSLALRLSDGRGLPSAARACVAAYTAAVCDLVNASLYWLDRTGRFDARWLPPHAVSSQPWAGEGRRTSHETS